MAIRVLNPFPSMSTLKRISACKEMLLWWYLLPLLGGWLYETNTEHTQLICS